MHIVTSASMMCMNPLKLEEDIKTLEPYIDEFHADVMDGHYVPNLAMSVDLVADCVAQTSKPVEVHLMVTDPTRWVPRLLAAGVKRIQLHAEVINAYAFRVINQIRDSGCEVGIVLNPSTPFSYCSAYMNLVDQITIMTVDAGYAGQAFIPQMIDKIKEADAFRATNNLSYTIQVDGACNSRTYPLTMAAGASSFVLGSSGLFGIEPTLVESALRMHRELNEAALESGTNLKPSKASVQTPVTGGV